MSGTVKPYLTRSSELLLAPYAIRIGSPSSKSLRAPTTTDHLPM